MEGSQCCALAVLRSRARTRLDAPWRWTALDVLVNEDLAERSLRLARSSASECASSTRRSSSSFAVSDCSNGVVIDEQQSKKRRNRLQLCLLMKSKG